MIQIKIECYVKKNMRDAIITSLLQIGIYVRNRHLIKEKQKLPTQHLRQES